MRIIGLTGGIASGKSTTRRLLEGLGAKVIDADQVYHGLIAPTNGRPSPLALQINAEFPGVLLPTGEIDRRSLGEVVFSNTEAKARLEGITHPKVAQATAQAMAHLADAGCEMAFYDVPLLYERGLEAALSGVIVVWVPEMLQQQRLMQRDHIDAKTAQKRIKSQLPLNEKRQRADWVVDNSGSLEATEQQVNRLWAELQGS